MTGGWRLSTVGRLVFIVFCAITAIYCLFTFIPLTYHQAIEFGWFNGFVRLHPWLYWVAWLSIALSLLDDLESPARGLILGLLLAGALTGVGLLWRPLLTVLRSDASSLWWSTAWLVPLWWLALIDWVAQGRRLSWGAADPGDDRRILTATLTTALAVTLGYAIIVTIRFHGTEAPLPLAQASLAWLWSLSCHLLAFMALCAALLAARGVASLTRRASVVEFVLVNLGGTVLLGYVLDTVVLNAVSVTGATAVAIAAVTAASVVLTLTGFAVRRWPASTPVTSGLALALRPLHPRVEGSAVRIAAAACGLALLAYGVSAATAIMDWNFLGQTLGALSIWTLVFAFVHASLGGGRRVGPTVLLLLPALLALGGFRALSAFQPAVGRAMAGTTVNVPTVLDRYAGYDVSFRTVHEWVRPVPPPIDDAGEDYFGLAQRHTNIARTVAIPLPDIHLVEGLSATAAFRPHVFVFVIDSLRQDYLAPYNPRVGFTPAIAAFARDAYVFRNAFTHYGATGLAEPSIWTGGMIPHQQYPPSFGSINALRKLLVADGYRAHVSMDTILRVTLDPWPGLVELDAGVPNMDYDLCRTLNELEARLRARPADATQPEFAFTLPQNIHIAAITREGKTNIDGGAYDGFSAPYASRVKRIDGCFGGFIQTLKDTGLYDQSVVVFTSDHGDSLGEEGRWGHAYTVFPEILRVPLLVRLPPSLRGLEADTSEIVFTTDLTPSLYYLLGHRPTMPHPLFGGPLFTERAEERVPYRRDGYVVGSSYGPVYGWLANQGRGLYILDAANYREYAYDLTTGTAGSPAALTPTLRRDGGRAIKATIAEIAKFYRIPLDH